MEEKEKTFLDKKVEELKALQMKTSTDMDVFNHGFASQITNEFGADIKQTLTEDKNYYFETSAALDKEEEDEKLNKTEPTETEENKDDKINDKTTKKKTVKKIKEGEIEKVGKVSTPVTTEDEKKPEGFFTKLFRIL